MDAVTHVLLFVLHVCMLRECEGDGNAGMVNGGVVSSVGDMLELSMMCVMRGWAGN